MTNYSLNQAQARGQQGYAVLFVALVVFGIIFAAFQSYKPKPDPFNECIQSIDASLRADPIMARIAERACR